MIRRGWSEKRTRGLAIAAGLGFRIGLNAALILGLVPDLEEAEG